MVVKAYLASVIAATISKTTPWGLVGALVVAGIWASYLLKIPRSSDRVIPRYGLLLVLGGFSAALTVPASGLLFSLLPLVPGQTWQHDIIISLIHIGLLEEIFKFLPVLIVMALSQHRRETIDWIVSGGFSALGFATLENIIYFSRSGLGIVPSRFLFTTSLHLAATGIIAAVWVRGSMAGKSAPATRLGAISAVIVAHAAFDFFILGPFSSLAPLSIVIVIALAKHFTKAVQFARSIDPSQHFHWLTSQAGNTFRLLFLSTLALLVLSSAYTYQQLPTTHAARQIGAAIFITLPVAGIVFRWWGQLTQKESPLAAKLNIN